MFEKAGPQDRPFSLAPALEDQKVASASHAGSNQAMSLRAKTKYVPAAKPASNAGVTLYATADAVGCHWIRLVLAEKDVPGVRVETQSPGRMSEDLALLNPAQTLPTLTDRETVIYPARLIAEVLDER